MYRYSVDNAITYTSEDFVLFKESPFASWMERPTLENPDHGILPQAGSEAPTDTVESQDDLADTLCAEGKDVVLVNWERDEAARNRHHGCHAQRCRFYCQCTVGGWAYVRIRQLIDAHQWLFRVRKLSVCAL